MEPCSKAAGPAHGLLPGSKRVSRVAARPEPRGTLKASRRTASKPVGHGIPAGSAPCCEPRGVEALTQSGSQEHSPSPSALNTDPGQHKASPRMLVTTALDTPSTMSTAPIPPMLTGSCTVLRASNPPDDLKTDAQSWNLRDSDISLQSTATGRVEAPVHRSRLHDASRDSGASICATVVRMAMSCLLARPELNRPRQFVRGLAAFRNRLKTV